MIAFAFHDHKNMSKLFAPPLDELLEKAGRDPGAWENDQWWTS